MARSSLFLTLVPPRKSRFVALAGIDSFLGERERTIVVVYTRLKPIRYVHQRQASRALFCVTTLLLLYTHTSIAFYRLTVDIYGMATSKGITIALLFFKVRYQLLHHCPSGVPGDIDN
jgi:hypothetical protein